MSLKTKLISSISAFVLVLALLVVGVFALPQETFTLGGTINFQAKNVYAEITGTISGQENGPASLPKLEFSNNKTPDTSGWAKGALVFDPNASPIQIQIAINVKNLSGERSLFVKVDDLIGAVTNLTKSVMVGADDKEGAYVKVLPFQSVDYVISLSPTDEGEPVTGEYNYLITLVDETEATGIQIQAKANQASLGSVSGGGTFDLGDTVELTATTKSGSTFRAWATSLKPNEMEIISTSSTYSFELTMDSPRTYYALFNKTTSTRQPVGNLIYTFYNEAKLAEITGTDSSFQGGDFTIPSVVSKGGNSYKVYSIGNNAFRNCSRLTSITIPEGVTSIGVSAFALCKGLTSITLPSTLTSIGTSAFFNCSSLEAFYGNGNSYYTIDDNRSLILDGGKTLFAYAVANSATSYSIPKGVTTIRNNAFYNCSNLTSITLPSTLTSIGLYAFSDCSSLTSITIPAGVTSIGYQAFYNCSSLTSITLPSKLTSIGASAFENCSGLTSISLPSTLTSIGDDAFYNCSGLTQITINGNISTLSSNVFQSCTNLTKLTLGANVKSIPSSLFTDNNLTRLTEIVVEKDSTLSAALPTYAKWYKDDDPTEVKNFRGAGTYSTTKPQITVTVLPNQESLGSVSGGGTFDLGDEINLTATPDGSNKFLAWATPTDLDTMEILSTSSTYSFELSPDSPRTYYALFNSTETEQTDGELEYTIYEDAKLAEITGTDSSFQGGDFTIPSVVPSGENSYKVYSIGNNAFQNCSNLTTITIPEGVTSIGQYAFDGCSSLTSIKIPEGVTLIDTSAFRDCSSLTSITIPEGVTSIGASAFRNCRSLTSIKIPEGVTSIGARAFENCSGLTSITIPEGVTSIGANAFWGCSSLTSITILKGVTSIGNSAFEGCSSLTSITIPEGVTSIGNSAFSDCTSLTTISIPEGVTSIGNSAFRNCSGLTSITIPERVTSIGSSAFNYCSRLTSITLPNTLTSIGNSAFWNCTSLTTITIPEGVTSIGDNAFRSCSGLTSITIPEGVTSIGGFTFYGCSGLTSVNLPSKLTSIGDNAFYGCSSLTSITIPDGVTSIGFSAFEGCSSLTEITINGNISTLESYAFPGCIKLTKLTLGAGVTRIPSNLFTDNNLTELNEIVVEEGSSLTAALPSGETWVKDGKEVTMLDGAGVYAKQA